MMNNNRKKSAERLNTTNNEPASAYEKTPETPEQKNRPHNKRNGSFVRMIAKRMRSLNYKSACEALLELDEKERRPYDWFQIGVCHSGMQHWKEAIAAYEKCLDIAPTSLYAAQVYIRLCRQYTQTGQLDLASQAVHKARMLLNENSDSPAAGVLSPVVSFLNLSEAWMLFEFGDIDGALANTIAICELPESPKLEALKIEAWTLRADLLSIQGMSWEAIEGYEEALRRIDASHDRHSTRNRIKKALLYNNMADVYEGEEIDAPYEDGVLHLYNKAIKLIRPLADKQIVDLAGCALEIYLSAANYCADWDDDGEEYEDSDNSNRYAKGNLIDEDRTLSRMERYLLEAEKWLAKTEAPADLYWKSRIEYIRGLSILYCNPSDPDAFRHLIHAWSLQRRFLEQSPVSSQEYLGRIAYYAAYCYSEQVVEEESWSDPYADISQRDLYEHALRAFNACSFKDPKFFLFSIASIYNELGTIARNERYYLDACRLYDLSSARYLTYLRKYPHDHAAMTNLVVVMLNLISTLDDPALMERGEHLLCDLFDLLNALADSLYTFGSIYDALNRIMDDERLYRYFRDLLEERYIPLSQKLARREKENEVEPWDGFGYPDWD